MTQTTKININNQPRRVSRKPGQVQSDVLVGERKQDTAASAIERRLGWPLSLYA